MGGRTARADVAGGTRPLTSVCEAGPSGQDGAVVKLAASSDKRGLDAGKMLARPADHGRGTVRALVVVARLLFVFTSSCSACLPTFASVWPRNMFVFWC